MDALGLIWKGRGPPWTRPMASGDLTQEAFCQPYEMRLNDIDLRTVVGGDKYFMHEWAEQHSCKFSIFAELL